MKLLDNRLFKGELLYCEGKYKPFLRGKIHLASLLFFPVGIYFVYHSNHPIIGSVNVISNMGCFGISGIYHTFDWSPSTEIVLQKLDHFAISLWCLLMMTPIAFILFPIEIRIPFVTIVLSTFFMNSHAIWRSRPSVIKSSAIAGSLLLFLPVCYEHMNDYEWKCMWLSYAFQGAGTMAYVKNQKKDTTQFKIFGYHELFHALTLFAAFHIYMLNYSIINRS
jgi:hemolysin III